MASDSIGDYIYHKCSCLVDSTRCKAIGIHDCACKISDHYYCKSGMNHECICFDYPPFCRAQNHVCSCNNFKFKLNLCRARTNHQCSCIHRRICLAKNHNEIFF